MAVSSPTTPCASTRSARGCGSPAMPACRPTTAPMRRSSTCSSTAGRCATGCCRARCAAPMPTSSPATAIRRGAVPRAAGGGGRCQCPSGQGRGALPRSGPGARLIVGSLSHALAEAGHRASTTVAGGARGQLPARAARRQTETVRPRGTLAGTPRFRAASLPEQAAAVYAPFRGVDASPRKRSNRVGRGEVSRWVWLGRSCTRPILWRRPQTGSSSSISTPRMSGWSTSA